MGRGGQGDTKVCEKEGLGHQEIIGARPEKCLELSLKSFTGGIISIASLFERQFE